MDNFHWWAVFGALVFWPCSVFTEQVVQQSTGLRPVNLLVINDEGNELANQSIDIALADIRAKDPTVLGNVIIVQLNESDPREALEQVCGVWDSAVKNGTSGVPDLVLDTTRSYFGTKTVNVFAAFLGIPKISARYGQQSDVKHWQNLTVNQTNYLVQIMPPVNLIPKAFRQLDCERNVSNVAIIFDDTYFTDRMYKGLLQNISSRHIVVQAEADNPDIEQQLERIRDLDVVNYFVLGNETTLTNYLDVADDKNLTGCRYGIGSNQAHLRSLTAQNLLPPVWLTVAFYYDVVRIGVGAMKSAIEKKSWPTSLKPRFITCEEYNGNNTPTHNFDLLGELRNATTNKLEPTFTRFHWGENNGEHHAEFNIRVNMVVINDGNSTFSDDLALWNVDIRSPSSNTSSRRYEWFKDNNDEVYGHFNHGNCLNRIESVESYYHAGKLRECDYCVCTCVMNPFSKGSQVTVFSFREQVSDIDDGMVVVGVKFIKKNNMMHIQIKQGKLFPNGLIRFSNWKELETIRKDDKLYQFFIDVNVTYSKQLTSGVDYGFTNGINFDDVYAPEGFVVTGVRLLAGNFDSEFEDSIGLEIRITRFDFSSGKLSLFETYWTKGSEGAREEIVMPNPDNPTRSPKNLIISKKNKFIRFGASDLKKDAGQSTVPFFDAQEVEGDPEFALGGVGIILRGQEGYGGFWPSEYLIYRFTSILCLKLTSKTNTSLAHYTEVPTYRIVTVERPPLIEFNKETKKWEGICIDLLEEMQKYTKFNYEIYESPDGEYGSLNDKGEWNGMIKELMTDKADVALGALSVTATREYVIDFTVPYYEPVGYSVITKRRLDSTSLFVFRKSMSWKVWTCSLAAFISTSLLIYTFDRWSPYSYRNDPHNKNNTHHKRIFTLRNSFWYTMSCLGPSGGGPPPKNFSGQILACSWWGFGFITIAAYSANLAASTTVGRLQPTIKTWDQVREQFKIQYAPIKGSNAYQYFFGMKAIEESFYDIWKGISLNDSLTDRERAQYAVWDYPVDDEFSRIVSHMDEYGYPISKEDALNRMFGLPPDYTNESNFALIDEATELRYWALTNCSFFLFEGEFTKKPYAIAVQQGSPIKDIFDHALIELEKNYTMKRLMEKWWDNNPKRVYNCPEPINRSEGLHIGNIGGIFIVLAVGNVIGFLTVILQYWWYCLRSRTRLRKMLKNGFSLDKAKPKKFKVKPLLRKITRPDNNPSTGVDIEEL